MRSNIHGLDVFMTPKTRIFTMSGRVRSGGDRAFLSDLEAVDAAVTPSQRVGTS